MHMWTNKVMGFIVFMQALEQLQQRPWSTMKCMDNEPKPSRGIPCLGFPKKTVQFRLNPTQNYAPRRQCHQSITTLQKSPASPNI